MQGKTLKEKKQKESERKERERERERERASFLSLYTAPRFLSSKVVLNT